MTIDAQTLVTLVYDHETGTVLAAEDCSVMVCTLAESETLADGDTDWDHWEPTAQYPVMRDVQLDSDSCYVEVNYPDGTSARWTINNATGDRVANMLGTPDTLKC